MQLLHFVGLANWNFLESPGIGEGGGFTTDTGSSPHPALPLRHWAKGLDPWTTAVIFTSCHTETDYWNSVAHQKYIFAHLTKK